jgi:hypothetical protein
LPDALKGSNSGTSSNSNGGGPSTDGPANPGKVTSSGDPKADIERASKKFVALPSFSADMNGTGDNPMHMRLEYVSPDRYHIIHLGGPASGMETIIVGKNTYMKTGGVWRKFPVDVGSSIPNLRESFTEEGLRTMTDVKFEGDDAVGGKPGLLYSYTNTLPKTPTQYTSKIWVSKDTGLPMKILVDYQGGALKQAAITYDTETKLTIESPLP